MLRKSALPPTSRKTAFLAVRGSAEAACSAVLRARSLVAAPRMGIKSMKRQVVSKKSLLDRH
jgi:hypothetical protein